MTATQAPSDDAPDPRVGSASHAPLVVDRAVVDAVAAHVGGDTTVERGGVLVGNPSGERIHISAAIRAERATSHPSALTFTHEAWDEVNSALERDHPGQHIVGWYHSHPGFSVFLSEYDTFIHRNFFSAPWQVAYVVDPLLGEDGFFGWGDQEIVRYASWDVRATTARRDAAVAVPAAPRSAASAVVPVNRSRLVVSIAAVGIVGALGGYLAGDLLGGDTSRSTPTTSVAPTEPPLTSVASTAATIAVDPTALASPPEPNDPAAADEHEPTGTTTPSEQASSAGP